MVSCDDRADPPAHRVGRVELDQRRSDIDRHHVRRARDDQRGEAQREPVATAEGQDRGGEDHHRDQHLHPDILLHRPEREPDRRRPPRRSPCPAASTPEPVWPDVQDVAREHRQQRGRAGEQHGEQVERDRRQHQPVVADVTEAVERCAGAGGDRFCAGGCGTLPIRKIERKRDERTTLRSRRRRRRDGWHRASRRRSGRRSSRSATRSSCTAIAVGRLSRGTRLGASARIGRPGKGAANADHRGGGEQAPAGDSIRPTSAARASSR